MFITLIKNIEGWTQQTFQQTFSPGIGASAAP
jgi:hypothetical protein